MKFVNKIIFLIIISTLLFVGCEDRSDLTAPGLPSTGEVSFDRYVAIGNSLTAGYQSNSLYKSAQDYSFGKIIADQVGVDFEQPIVSDPGTIGRMEIESLDPFSTTINMTQGTPTNTTLQRPYNNLGIPGALLYDVLNATDATNCAQALAAQAVGKQNPNPMFDLILRGLGTQLDQAISMNPTLVTLWIGNNDILGFATRGGTVPYTDVPTFTGLYSMLADSLNNNIAENGKVLVANIPSITAIPFFTTVPPLVPDGSGGYLKVYGETSSGVRELVVGKDLLTLTAQEALGQMIGLSPNNPLPTQYVLDEQEVGVVISVMNEYNAVISGIAETYENFELVDVNALMNKVASETGLYEDGINFTSEYVNGKVFSLDGVHPTSQGYALVANEFIKVINSKFDANISHINVGTIPGSLILAKN